MIIVVINGVVHKFDSVEAYRRFMAELNGTD